jgi:hypothetical protein
MLKGMREQLRCCIATIGDGAAADPDLYKDLYGTILIWLGEGLWAAGAADCDRAASGFCCWHCCCVAAFASSVTYMLPLLYV